MQINPDNIRCYLTAPEGQAGALNEQEQKVAEAAQSIFGQNIGKDGPSDEKLQGCIDACLFNLAINDKSFDYQEPLSDVYKRLCKCAGDQELDPKAIPMIVQDTNEAVGRGLIDKNQEEPYVDLELEGNTISINCVALYAMSKPFYFIAEGIDMRGIPEGEMIMSLLPEGVEAIKTYVETRELPDFSNKDLDFLISTYNFLEKFLFPDEIRDHFIARIIDVLAVKKKPESFPIPEAVDRIRAFGDAANTLKDIHSAILPIKKAVVERALPALIEVSDRQKKIDILQTIALLPEAEITENTGVYVKDLFSHANIKANTTAVLAQLQTLPHPRLRYIALAVIGLMPEERKNISTFEEIVSRLRALSDPNNEEALISMINTFFAFERDLLNAITQAFEQVNHKNAETYLRILPLFPTKTSERERQAILRTIGKITAAQRADVVEKAQPILRATTDSHNIRQLLEVISAIDRDQRADVIKEAKPLLKAKLSDTEKVEILRVISVLDPKERIAILKQAKRVLKSNASSLQIRNVIKAISAIDAERRKVVVESAARLRDYHLQIQLLHSR